MTPSTEPNGRPEHITIHLDQDVFHLDHADVTADDLRALPDPDVSADRDLYLEVDGPGEDQLIASGDHLHLKSGMHFFTAPAAITPGC